MMKETRLTKNQKSKKRTYLQNNLIAFSRACVASLFARGLQFLTFWLFLRLRRFAAREAFVGGGAYALKLFEKAEKILAV